jgi:predicted alpha/beta-fold hydrolase
LGVTPFDAPRWLGNGHLQTLAASLPLWAPPRSFPDEPEHARIPLPDGGALHARAYWQRGGGQRTAVLLVHGLGGTSQSRYVVRAAVAFHRAGFHAVCLDLRGVGEGVTDAFAVYHAGLTEDPRLAAEWLASRADVSSVVVVGFSMGGHVAIRLAGELGDARGPVSGVVAISAPLDLLAVSRAIERLRSWPYHQYVLRNLVKNARAFAERYPDRARFDASRLSSVGTIRAYDDLVSAPSHGFADADDYYRRASAGPFVPRIRLPTLLLHAEDDPMVPPSCVRPWLDEAPDAVTPIWSRRGGHVAWVGGLSEDTWVDTWPIQRAREFAERVSAGK